MHDLQSIGQVHKITLTDANFLERALGKGLTNSKLIQSILYDTVTLELEESLEVYGLLIALFYDH